MNTYESSQRTFKPVFGAIAVAAAMATLGLAVVGPVALSKPSFAEPQITARTSARPTEVAILPGTIQVVAKRTRTAQAGSPFLPASYNVR